MMRLTTEFQPIRDWADQKGILSEGDPKTQLIKLMEEIGELSEAVLKNDKEEISDAIGDSVIVLTGLAAMCQLCIEDCIEDSFAIVSKRNGKMINGTFVKN